MPWLSKKNNNHCFHLGYAHVCFLRTRRTLGMSRSLIVDTGWNISILQPGISKGNVSVTPLEPYGVTGDALDIKGKQTVTVVLNGSEFTHTFLVCSLPTAQAGLVGTDFMYRLGAVIDFECSKMTPPSTQYPENMAARWLGTQHSLFFLRVKKAVTFAAKIGNRNKRTYVTYDHM